MTHGNAPRVRAPFEAAARAAGLAAIAVLVTVGIAACGGSSKKSTQANTTPTQRAPTTQGTDTNAKARLLALGATFNAAQRRFFSQVAADSRARNFTAVKADVSQFRDAIYNFDVSGVRKIHFAPSLQTDVNAVLEGSRTSVAELDAMGQTKGFVDFLPLFKRFIRDKGTLIGAVNKLIGELK